MDKELKEQSENSKMTGIFYKYALVLVDVPNLGTRTFSYLIPKELSAILKIGIPVLVPFGQKGAVNAFVVGFSNYLEENIKAKKIIEILDSNPIFDLKYLELIEWISNYYCCDLNTTLQAAIPMKFLKQTKRIAKLITPPERQLEDYNEKILQHLKEDKPVSTAYLRKKSKLSYSKFYTAIRKLQQDKIIELENILDDDVQSTKTEYCITFKSNENATKRQLEILEKLKNLGTINLVEFEKIVKTTRSTTKKLQENNCVDIFEKETFRNPLNFLNIDKMDTFPELSTEQETIYEKIANKIDEKQTTPTLLYGVTASGKTEVYFKAIKKVLDNNKNVLFLAPEIALASQLTRRLAKRFGIEDVALWHSSISDGERYDVWQKLRNNKIRILAGARSAVLAPLQNIGLIIIDEEHESTYKQTSPAPRYNAKTVAKKLAEQHDSLLLLGSATPDIQSFYEATNTDNLLVLKTRYNNAPMASVGIIDMREEFYKQNKSIFSRTLIRELEENLANKKQSMLLLNRRGYATQTQCIACGEIIKCENCAIPMVWHNNEQKLKCHWCNSEQEMPKTCPNCGSIELKTQGIGTQKIETSLQKVFPSAKIARLDSDVLTKKTAYIEILDKFESGEIDILIGTQMIAKGLDNENVTLVGVINADSSFNLPDYRASERGFQLLTQIAGRAGRGNFKGKVYFQTLNPNFYAIETAKEQNYEHFYKEEIISREAFDYPPFSQIIKLVICSKNNFRAEKSAQEIALRLNEIIDKKGISEPLSIFGPTNCILEKINNEYRFQIIIKNKLGKKGHFFVNSFLSKIKMPEDIKLIIDIDPIDIL